jgi:hypothetical protein
MPETPFIITIDTEGDNLWSRPREITTRNAACLPRFQALCERYRYRPVYLVNYEMAVSPLFVEFGRDVLARGAAEIGMHLHAWNSPPLTPLTVDDYLHQTYLIEYPGPVMREKIRYMTALLEDEFQCKMASHRAGRWGFDGRYAAMLIDEGYLVDCSVVPGVDWGRNPGAPGGRGGSDYRGFPDHPYFLSPADISAPGAGPLLEVPMTVRASPLYRRAPWAYRLPVVRQIAHRISPALRWLCPVTLMEAGNLDAMLEVARAARAEGVAHMEFMLHSSELMPGGSECFRDAAAVDRLYERIEALFDALSGWCRGTTLRGLYTELATLSPHAVEEGAADKAIDAPRTSAIHKPHAGALA